MTLTVASPVAYSFLIIRNEQGRLTERTSSTTHSSHKWYNLSAADSEDVKNLQRRTQLLLLDVCAQIPKLLARNRVRQKHAPHRVTTSPIS